MPRDRWAILVATSGGTGRRDAQPVQTGHVLSGHAGDHRDALDRLLELGGSCEVPRLVLVVHDNQTHIRGPSRGQVIGSSKACQRRVKRAALVRALGVAGYTWSRS